MNRAHMLINGLDLFSVIIQNSICLRSSVCPILTLFTSLISHNFSINKRSIVQLGMCLVWMNLSQLIVKIIPIVNQLVLGLRLKVLTRIIFGMTVSNKLNKKKSIVINSKFHTKMKQKIFPKTMERQLSCIFEAIRAV